MIPVNELLPKLNSITIRNISKSIALSWIGLLYKLCKQNLIYRNPHNMRYCHLVYSHPLHPLLVWLMVRHWLLSYIEYYSNNDTDSELPLESSFNNWTLKKWSAVWFNFTSPSYILIQSSFSCVYDYHLLELVEWFTLCLILWFIL